MTDQPDYSIDTIARARQLRRAASPIEDRVWGFLRNGHVDGLKFRRQHPLGRYVADFYCHAHRLVIEIDGPSHNDQQEHDLNRTLWLNQNGYRVIRFTNHDVLNNPNGVREAIREACRDVSPLTRRSAPTSPRGRGERTTSIENSNGDGGDAVRAPLTRRSAPTSPRGRGEQTTSSKINTHSHNPSTTCSPPPQGEVVPALFAGTGEGTRATRTSAQKSI